MGADSVSSSPRVVHASASSIVWGASDVLFDYLRAHVRPLARIERMWLLWVGVTSNGLLAPLALWMRVPGSRRFGSKSGIIMFVPGVAHYDRLCTPGGRSGLSFDDLEPYLAPTLSASARFGAFGHFSQPSSPQPTYRRKKI